MRREREGSVVFNGGRLAVPGKRRVGMAVFALLVTLFVFTLLADSAWAQAQLDVEKTDNPDPVAEGETLTYTIVVSNPNDAGNQDAEDVELVDTLPADVTFVSANSTASNPCTEAAGVVTCDLDTIPDGESETVTIEVTPDAAAVGTVITNSATASCTGAVACLPDTDEQNTAVVPDLEINKLDDPDPVSTEDLLLYQLRLQNQGSTTLTPGGAGANADIEVVDDLPLADVDLVSFESEDFDCVFNAGLIQCDLTEELSPGEVVTVDIVVEPEEPGVTLQNTAEVFFDNPAIAAFPNSLVDEDTEDTEVEDNNNDNDDNSFNRRGGINCRQILDLTTGDQTNDQNGTATGGSGGDADGGDGGDGTVDQDASFGDVTTEQIQNCIRVSNSFNNNGNDDNNDNGDDNGDEDEDTDDDTDDTVDDTDETVDDTSEDGEVLADSTDPDTQEPVSGPQGDVLDEVNTAGEELPNTGGVPVAALGPLVGIALIGGGLWLRWMGRRRR